MEKYSCVLIIDDDEISNHIHEQLFRRLDLSKNIMIAKNGSEALNFIKYFYQNSNRCPELIFISQKLAQEDQGNFLELFYGMELKDENLKIIIMNGGNNKLNSKIPLEKELNISDMVNKPLTRQKIETVLQPQKKD